MCSDGVTKRNEDDCNVISSGRDTISTTSLKCETFGKGYHYILGMHEMLTCSLPVILLKLFSKPLN